VGQEEQGRKGQKGAIRTGAGGAGSYQGTRADLYQVTPSGVPSRASGKAALAAARRRPAREPETGEL